MSLVFLDIFQEFFKDFQKSHTLNSITIFLLVVSLPSYVFSVLRALAARSSQPIACLHFNHAAGMHSPFSISYYISFYYNSQEMIKELKIFI